MPQKNNTCLFCTGNKLNKPIGDHKRTDFFWETLKGISPPAKPWAASFQTFGLDMLSFGFLLSLGVNLLVRSNKKDP